MRRRGKNLKQEVIILLAQGFSETWLANCVATLRDTGYKTTMVGLIPGLITGKHGMVIQTDRHFSELSNDPPKILAIAAGQQCINKLLSEPNVHTLINHTIESGGQIAVTTESERILKECGRVHRSQFDNYIWQRAMPTPEYAQLLANSIGT